MDHLFVQMIVNYNFGPSNNSITKRKNVEFGFLDSIRVGRFTPVEHQHVVPVRHRPVDSVAQQQQRLRQQMEIKRYAMRKLNALKKFSSELNESNYSNKNASGEKRTAMTNDRRLNCSSVFPQETNRSFGQHEETCGWQWLYSMRSLCGWIRYVRYIVRFMCRLSQSKEQ